MDDNVVQKALAPLLISAFVLGVRGFGGSKSNIEIVYGLIVIFLPALLVVFLGISYYKFAIGFWEDKFNLRVYFMLWVEVLGFFGTTFLSIPSCIFIIKGKYNLTDIVSSLNNHSKTLHCESIMSTEMRRFAVIYTISAWLGLVMVVIVQCVMWYFLGPNYLICCSLSYTLILQHSMLEGQMLAIMQAKKILFRIINLELKNLNERQENISTFLLKLRKSHLSLSLLDEDVNKTFGIILVFNIVTALFGMVSNMYYVITTMLELDEEVRAYRHFTLIGSGEWFLLTNIRLITLAFIAHSTTAQARETSSFLREIEFKINDKNIRDEISVFSMQLVHCPAPRYTVLGLFPLDLSMLASIYAAIATYMVIMLQFYVSTY